MLQKNWLFNALSNYQVRVFVAVLNIHTGRPSGKPAIILSSSWLHPTASQSSCAGFQIQVVVEQPYVFGVSAGVSSDNLMFKICFKVNLPQGYIN